MLSIDDIFKRANSTGRSLSSAGAGERSFITCRDQVGQPESAYTSRQSVGLLGAPDRQVADALSGGMKDRIGHGRVGANIAEFAESHYAKRIHFVILLQHEDHLHLIDGGRSAPDEKASLGYSLFSA